MSEIVRLKIPEPVTRNGRDRFVCGWNTAGIGQWLLNKKFGEHHTTLSEIASTAYARDNEGNRQKVKNNISSLRRWLADRGEFLLMTYGYARRVTAVKVCNPNDENDRPLAVEQLMRLEARAEITAAERIRWEQMLFLPKSHPSPLSSDDENEGSAA